MFYNTEVLELKLHKTEDLKLLLKFEKMFTFGCPFERINSIYRKSSFLI